jgi:hypothetical protein
MSITDGKVRLSPEFIEKHDFSWEKLASIHAGCERLTFPKNETEPCPYEQKLEELSADFELVLRVMQMNALPHQEINSNESK